MELDRWQLPGDLFEGVQGNIKPLMPLESTWIKNDLPAVLANSWDAPQQLRITILDKNRAASIQSCSASVFVQPEMVGDDHAICKTSRSTLHPHQQSPGYAGRSYPEFAGKELRNDIMDIENHRHSS